MPAHSLTFTAVASLIAVVPQLELQLPPADCIAMDEWHASVRKSAAATEREIAAWKKSRAGVVANAYEELLALASAEVSAAEQAADSE